MTVRSLLRLVAGLALALFVAASWATPSEAHSGHGAPAATTQQAHDKPTTTSKETTSQAAAAEQVAESSPTECGGHMNQNGSDNASCCSNTCHAAMATDMEALQAVGVVMTILQTLTAAPELSGPTMHLKRPPRSSAALVG